MKPPQHELVIRLKIDVVLHARYKATRLSTLSVSHSVFCEKMATRLFLALYFASVVSLLIFIDTVGAIDMADLEGCLRLNGIANYTTRAQGSSFSSLWLFSLKNLRFTEPNVPRPNLIVLPSSPAQVSASLSCIRRHAPSWNVISRSGGHSYEGLSSTADPPFAIIDLMNLNSITVHAAKRVAWVGAGATLGELYYAISSASPTLGFPAGTCATNGISGHLSGGGFGVLSRKYGVAADNILEAQIVVANGTLLDRVSVSDKDLFWAVRGGGGGSWGIVVAWKVRLVPVPMVVTTFVVLKSGKQAISSLMLQWQSVAHSAPAELFISSYMAASATGSTTELGLSIYGQHLGSINETVAVVDDLFPELGLTAENCKQGSWIEAAANIAQISSPSAFLSRQQASKIYFKNKSDYVGVPLTKEALSGAFDILLQNTRGSMIFEPYGGIMDKISTDAIPFPHRAGTLFMIQYIVQWQNNTASLQKEMIEWIRKLYDFMGSHVLQSPVRAAYVNYIDLDLGDGTAAGPHYFGSNFDRLVAIKGRVDPRSFFHNSQSIPTKL